MNWWLAPAKVGLRGLLVAHGGEVRVGRQCLASRLHLVDGVVQGDPSHLAVDAGLRRSDETGRLVMALARWAISTPSIVPDMAEPEARTAWTTVEYCAVAMPSRSAWT